MTPHRCSRTELLRVLETVQPGLSAKETLQQSSCFVFRKGWVATFNEEVFCRMKTGLPNEVSGAVKADPLLKLLRQLTHDDLLVTIGDGAFQVAVEGKRTESGVRMEAEILLPVGDIEKPDEWRPLHEEFEEAVGIVKEAAGKDDEQFLTVCLNIAPGWIEACDRFQATRYKLDTGVEEAFLVRASAARHVAALGFTDWCVTETWVHFRNAHGLIMACRRYLESFPDMTPLLEFDGEPATLPAGLEAAAKLAEIFSAEDKDNNKVEVTLTEGRMDVEGRGTSGWVKRGLKMKYHGRPTRFQVSPTLLGALVAKSPDCEIGRDKLRVDQGKWVYITCLAPVEDKKKSRQPEPEAVEA